MPEFALDKRLATGLPLRSLLAKTGTSDAVSRILPPRQLPTHPTSPQQHLSRPPHVAPVDFPNDYPPPPLNLSPPPCTRPRRASLSISPQPGRLPPYRTQLRPRGVQNPVCAVLLFNSGSDATRTFLRACRSRTTPCSTSRPSTPRCVTVGAPPALHRACTAFSHIMKCMRCTLRSGIYGTGGGKGQCVRRHRERE